MQKVPSVRVIVLATIVAFIFIPLIWLAAWVILTRLAGAPPSSAADLTGMLATIGGLMGAIFTVGGLIIALVAILTQIQLQDRVNQVLSRAQQVFEDKFEQDLRPAFEQRAQRQIEAALALFQASTATDWQMAESLTIEALEKYPEVEKARTNLGVRMSNEVIASIQRRMYQTVNPFMDLFQPPGLVLTTPTHGDQNASNIATLVQSRLNAEPPKVQAIRWLEEAIDKEGDQNGQLSAALALMYGVNEAYDLMMSAAAKAVTEKSALTNYLTEPNNLAMLVYGCGNDEDRIQRLGRVLNLTLPASDQEVIASLGRIDPSSANLYADWYAAETRPMNRPRSRYVTTVRIFKIVDADGGMTAQALILPYGANSYGVPPDTTTYPPALELVRKLRQEFFFVCPRNV